MLSSRCKCNNNNNNYRVKVADTNGTSVGAEMYAFKEKVVVVYEHFEDYLNHDPELIVSSAWILLPSVILAVVAFFL